MRVLLMDDQERLLLFRDSDLGLTPVPHWWITPGGGVGSGESDVTAALRELREETGLEVTAAELVGPVGRRTVVHGYSDQVTTQHDVFWLVTVPAFDVSTAGHTVEEQATMSEHHWWTRAELESVDPAEPVWPVDIVRLLEVAQSPDRSAWPVDLGQCEESTVPAAPPAS
ncbi:NUDIX domain-containing protein [Flexivirga caeni]|uniref:NUDIX domain-containing protein n=2 Tax=Flexivirga caeni TaxID=2294115 RepID=A0A3M9M7Z8_9MICO|nr:NUDIX domain-containing protein [Flexivirga caeni]